MQLLFTLFGDKAKKTKEAIANGKAIHLEVGSVEGRTVLKARVED